MPQFDFGAAEPIGRFSEGLLLRLLHTEVNASIWKFLGQKMEAGMKANLGIE